MNFESPSSLVQPPAEMRGRLISLAGIVLSVGSALLILPTMYEVATQTWTTEQGGHGPLVLATGLWAVWRELKGKKIEVRPGKLPIGVPCLALALAIFVLSRITGVLEVEDFAMYGALVSGAYLIFGGAVIRAIWFPLVYLAFALPPPDTVVAFVTQPVKIGISSLAVSALQILGYPVASSGVIIQIGQYELLVAAACAGLNSIVTLTALCLFYVYLRHRSNPIAFLVIAVAAIPVAIIANFVRVLALVLITYYFGESVAQGFVHDFAGLLMFSVALVTVFAIDQLATPLVTKAFTAPHMKPPVGAFNQPQIDRRKFVTGLFFGTAAGIAYARRPRIKLDYLGKNKLDDLIPMTVGRWNYVKASGLVVPPDDPLEKLIYAQVLTRMYWDGVNPPIMLLLAQNGSQTGFLQIHRPEVCYTAAGYQISPISPHPISVDGRIVPANRMDATNGGPTEHVVYWTRVGNQIPLNWRDQKLAVAEQNLRGVIPDAILVRVSTVNDDASAALACIDQFVSALLKSIRPDRRPVLVA